MSRRTYAAKDLFSYINLEENEDLTIEQYLTHSKNGNERKYRTKKVRGKYQKSVRILHRIFSTYYPSKELSGKLFPSFKNGLLVPKAEKRKTQKNPVTEDFEILNQDIPNIDEKVWNGLEFLFLLLIFSSIQKELPSNVDITRELSLRKSSRDSKKENDFFSLEKTNYDKNKFNIINNLHKDVETVLDALRIIKNQQTKKIDQMNFQEDDGFNDEEVVELIYNVTCDFSIDILTKHVLFFYKSYIRCLFPDFCQQQKEMNQRLEQQKQALNKINTLSQELVTQITVFQKNYNNEFFDIEKPISNILNELNTKQNWPKQRNEYLELYNKTSQLQGEIDTVISEYETI